MNEYLMRDGAPFGDEVWEKIDDTVVSVVKRILVGRRFVHLVGPLGWGVEVAPLFDFETEQRYVAHEAKYLPLQELSKEFMLRAKHLVMADQTPYDLDLGAVALAAAKLAEAEDGLVIGGLLENAKAEPVELGDWDVMGGPFRAVATATAQLLSTGFDKPYALVLNPLMYARLASLMQQGRRELELVEKLVQAGIFQSTAVPEDQAMVVSPHPWNFDLVVGQDVVTAYLANEGMDHLFRVFETLVLRVKRPGAICVLK